MPKECKLKLVRYHFPLSLSPPLPPSSLSKINCFNYNEIVPYTYQNRWSQTMITPNPGETIKQHHTLLVQAWNGATTLEYCLVKSTPAEHTLLPSISTHRYRVNEKYTNVPKIRTRRWIVAKNWKRPISIKGRDKWILAYPCDKIPWWKEMSCSSTVFVPQQENNANIPYTTYMKVNN